MESLGILMPKPVSIGDVPPLGQTGLIVLSILVWISLIDFQRRMIGQMVFELCQRVAHRLLAYKNYIDFL